ncbi:hypothetical protein M406DRAFT_270108 [Cryphonectria parasitica EP155]|uniref:RRM domain-containing protein n=1 Tax=Cryphonectria parasitica (strain ATCC 38755 / EP155) TaxID=660469 RepID=A0A9P5CHB4_CRYP1|nr:uncharacterized protein M406DRAFT_270108 [Cryphonectria parasitica EP155]KAF3760054.1 hypothetical protein M406DRAFT_270108 [Cryphonectria parasitica EP155]
MNNQGFSPPQNAGNQDFNQRGFPHYGHQQGQGHGKSIQYPGGHCGNLSSNRGVNHRAFGSFDGLSGNPQPIEAPTRAGPSSALVTHTSSTPNYVRSQRSDQLNDLTSGPDQRPAATIALRADNFPFVEGARYDYSPSTYGVVKIKNIPFDTNRAEIIAMLGRNSKIINDRHEPVHIIMERVTNRTGDAYVEFMTMYDAAQTVEKHQRASAQGRPHRLGDRPVEMELSSQAALMRDLFPNARGILWDGATPHIQPLNPTEPWLSFKGFITEEEMTMLVKHVEVPQRSPFSRDCPQRPFECMISTMRKFPWYMTDCITIKQRQSVYAACVNLLRLLQEAMEKKKHEHVLNSQLYRRLWTSAMICRGFTVTMKDSISYLVGLTDEDKREFNMPRFADQWVHIYTLVPKPGTPLDVIEWYIAIIREETNRTVAQSLPNVQSELQRQGRQTSLYWGYLWKEVSHPYGPGFDNMTLAEMAHREFSALSNILRRALD